MKIAITCVCVTATLLLYCSIGLSATAGDQPAAQPAALTSMPNATAWSPHLNLTGLVNISDTNAISLNFENIDIRVLLQYLSQFTGETIISEPGLKGTVTIVNPKPLTEKEAIQVIYSALALNGYTVIHQKHASKVVRAGNARSRPLPLYTHPVDDSDDTVRAQVVTLDYITPAKAGEFVKPFLTPGSGDVLVSDTAEMIILVDTGPNTKRIMELLALVDIPAKQQNGDIKVLPLRYISPREMTRLLTDIMNAPAFRDPRFYKRSGRPGYSATFIPLPGRNALIVICTRKNWPMIEKLIKQLDIPADLPEPIGNTTMIYHLSNAPAITVAATLQSTYKDTLTAVSYPPGNAVVVNAPSDMHRVLTTIVKKLDACVTASSHDFRIAGLTACTVIFFIMCVFLWLFRRRTAIPAV